MPAESQSLSLATQIYFYGIHRNRSMTVKSIFLSYLELEFRGGAP